MNFDIAIIGGGPGGYNAAEKAANNGLKVVVFEKNELGGVCLNEGCIPTKTLLHSAKLYDHAKEAKKYAIKIDGDITLDYKRLMARKSKIVKKLTSGVAFKMQSCGIEVVKEHVNIKGEDGEVFNLQTESGKDFQVKYLLICTGSEAFVPPIPGVEKVEYWTSREALSSKECPKSIVIVGGGVIGMEFASFFNSMGAEVSVVEMMPKILGPMDDECSAMLQDEFTKRGVNFHLNAKVTEILENGVRVEKDGKSTVIEGEKVLISVGRKANTEGFGLEALNIETNRRGIVTNEFMQSSNPRVYAAGDVNGVSMLAHTAYREGEVAIGHIIGENIPMSYRAIPGVVYTNPEIASVGATEEELKKADKYYRVVKLPMAYSGRFIVENETGNGIFKILVDENETILGCHMIGNPASEIIYGMGIAIENEETLETLGHHVYPHPTVAEIIHEALHV